MFKVPEQHRVITGQFATTKAFGRNGLFFIPINRKREIIRVIASDQDGWEHVSGSLPNRCPTWDEMSLLKDLFWDEADCVVQFHPPKSEHVNFHPYCLHLWRKIGHEFERPPKFLVGPVYR